MAQLGGRITEGKVLVWNGTDFAVVGKIIKAIGKLWLHLDDEVAE